MKKNILKLIVIFLISLFISNVKAYTTTESVDDLEIGYFIANESKLYTSANYSNNSGILINNIKFYFVPSPEDEINNEIDKNGNYINTFVEQTKPLSSIFIRKYEDIFANKLEYDGWLVTQNYYTKDSLNIYLEPVNKKDIKAKKINWYYYKEIKLDSYLENKNIESEEMNSSIMINISNSTEIVYEIKSKKNELLFFKIKANLIGSGNVKDDLEIFIDDEKQDITITNHYQPVKIKLEKGKHKLRFKYSNKNYGTKYIYLKSLGLIKDLDIHEETIELENYKKYSGVLKEEELNESHTLYSVEYTTSNNKGNKILIISVIILLILIIAIIIKKGVSKNGKRK